MGIPWMVAFALRADGWYLRSDIIWAKPNPMPESAIDRPTKAHEYVFLLSKNQRYYYDADAVREPIENYMAERIQRESSKGMTEKNQTDSYDEIRGNGGVARWQKGAWTKYLAGRNKRTVWTIPTQPFPEAHFAVFPEKLVEPCILAGCPQGKVVLDLFAGTGTVGTVAKDNFRKSILIDIKQEYCEMAVKRLKQEVFDFRIESGEKQINP